MEITRKSKMWPLLPRYLQSYGEHTHTQPRITQRGEHTLSFRNQVPQECRSQSKESGGLPAVFLQTGYQICRIHGGGISPPRVGVGGLSTRAYSLILDFLGKVRIETVNSISL